MFIAQKKEDYMQWVAIKTQYNFSQLGTSHLDSCLNEVNGYAKKYPNSKYAYILSKDFLLGIAHSLRKSFLKGADISIYCKELVELILFIQSKLKNDTLSEKKLLDEAVDKIYENLPKPKIKISSEGGRKLLESTLAAYKAECESEYPSGKPQHVI